MDGVPREGEGVVLNEAFYAVRKVVWDVNGRSAEVTLEANR
jgi:hypothetical protein